MGIVWFWLLDLWQETERNDADGRRRSDDRGILCCQQLAAYDTDLRRADDLGLSVDATRILNYLTLGPADEDAVNANVRRGALPAPKSIRRDLLNFRLARF